MTRLLMYLLSSAGLSIMLSTAALGNDALDLKTNFQATFTVHVGDMRGRGHGGSDSSDAATLVISSTPGGMLYRLTSGRQVTLFDYDEHADESYIADGGYVHAYNGLSSGDIDSIPLPGVGLYMFQLFSSEAPLTGDVRGQGYPIDLPWSVPAIAHFVMRSGIPECTRCTLFFVGTKLTRDDWTFGDPILFDDHWIARTSTCTVYAGYNPPNAPDKVPHFYCPTERITYQLVSIAAPTAPLVYDADSFLQSIAKTNSNRLSVAYFHNRMPVASFEYDPTAGSVAVQKLRALAIRGSSITAPFDHSITIATVAIAVTILPLIGLFSRRFHSHQSTS